MNMIIPARAGSRRVKRKNVRMVCGIPLVAWTIVQGVCAKGITEVWLTTDDDEIEAIGWKYGANVIRRPKWMCGPDADLYAANVPFEHLLEEIDKRGKTTDIVACALPTSPLRRPGDVDRHLDAYFNTPEWELPYVKQVIGMTQRQDTSFYIANPDTGVMEVSINDKSRKYWEYAGGMSVISTSGQNLLNDRIKEVYGVDHVEDQLIDGDLVAHAKRIHNDRYIGVPMELWQAHEIDTLDQFNLVQQLAKHFLMRNGDVDIFDLYRR